MARTCHHDIDETLRVCFNIFDEDESGFLTLDELIKLLSLNGVDYDDELGSKRVLASGATGSVGPSHQSAPYSDTQSPLVDSQPDRSTRSPAQAASAASGTGNDTVVTTSGTVTDAASAATTTRAHIMPVRSDGALTTASVPCSSLALAHAMGQPRTVGSVFISAVDDTIEPTSSAFVSARRDAIASRIAQAFVAMDTNADGKVSFEEFKKAVHSDPIIAEAVLMPFSDDYIATKLGSRRTGVPASSPQRTVANAGVPPGVVVVSVSSSRLCCC